MFGIAIFATFLPFGYIAGITVTFIVALLKEYFDSKGFGDVSKSDIAATVSGAFFLIGWYYIIDKLIVMF
jgi:hypothetical protein